MKYRFYIPCVVLLCLGTQWAMAQSVERDNLQRVESHQFTGTLFFTPEQRRTATAESEPTPRSNQPQTPSPTIKFNETENVRISFDGLLVSRNQQVAWINGRPLSVLSPRGFRSIELDGESEQLILQVLSGGVYRLTIGECLLWNHQVVDCESLRPNFHRGYALQGEVARRL